MSEERELAYICIRGCMSSSGPGVCAECAGTLWSPSRLRRHNQELTLVNVRQAEEIARLKAELGLQEEPWVRLGFTKEEWEHKVDDLARRYAV